MTDDTRILAEAHSSPEKLFHEMNFVDAGHGSSLSWSKYLSQVSKNGSRIHDNVLFDFDEKQEWTYLAHVTRNFDSIKSSGKLLASSGCLIGSIYCTPIIIDEKGRMRLHNLGQYILHKEAPAFSQEGAAPSLMVIAVENKPRRKKLGVNYMKLGPLHLNTYTTLRYLLSQEERRGLEHRVERAAHAATPLLKVTFSNSDEKLADNFENYYGMYTAATKDLPILGYILFETLCEFIAYHQHGSLVDHANDRRELFVGNFKDAVFELVPNLTRSFSLGSFTPDYESLLEFLKRNAAEPYSEQLIYLDIVRGLKRFIDDYLFLSDDNARHMVCSSVDIMSFNDLKTYVPGLVGHTIHRMLRTLDRYQSFYFYFDQYRALLTWNYWNKHDVSFPFNSLLPKGEIGVNPAYPNIKYQIFEAIPLRKGIDTYVELGNTLNITIEPHFADKSMLSMRRK